MIIRVHNPNGTIQEFPLQAPNELRFGSHPALEITLAGAGVSKLHGGFVFKEGKPCIVAAKPTEKLELNGKPVTRALLKSGDRIRVGDFDLEILQPDSPKAKTKSAKSANAAAKQQDDLGLAPESDELGLAPEPEPKPAKSQKAKPAQIDELDDAAQQSATEDLEILEGFEELTEIADAGSGVAPNSLDAVEELEDIQALDEMEVLAEPAGDVAEGEADWLQAGDLMAAWPAIPSNLTSGGSSGEIANLPGAGMVVPGGVAADEQKAEKKSRVKKKRNYGPLNYFAVALAGIGLLAAMVAPSMLGPSAQDQFAAADQLYQDQQLAEAELAFADFQQKYPRSIYTDEARIKHGLVKLLPLIDSPADLPADLQGRFATVQQVVRDLDDLAAHPLAQEQLGRILPPLANGLGEEALAMPVTAGLEKRSEALSQASQALLMTRRSLSPVDFASQDLGGVEIRLLLMDREISETKDLEFATAEIEKSLENSHFASGLATYDRLLDDHAAIADTPVLLNLMQRLSDGMASKVVFSKETLPPRGEQQLKSLPTITFAWQEIAASAGQPQPVCIFDSPSACVYCLDASSGALLWRKFIGFDAAFDPHSANTQSGEVVLHNAAIGAVEKLDGNTGEIVWSTPVGGNRIWLTSGKSSVFVSAAGGDAWELNRSSGELKRKITFPEPLASAAYVDEASGKLFQPAVAASLFNVALDQDSCDGVPFVGHSAYALRFPPADLSDHLAVLEDAGLYRSILKLIAKKGHSQLIQSIPFDARAAGGPLAEQNLLLLPTDDGRLLAFGIDDQNSSQPMSLKSETKWTDTKMPIGQIAWLKSIGGIVFQAGNGLQVFKQRTGADEYVLSNQLFPGREMIQPVEDVDGLIVVAYRDGHGITVEGLNSQDLASVWKTRVASRLLENAAKPLSIETENAFVVSADIERCELTKQQLSTTQNLVVNLPASKLNAEMDEPHLTTSFGADAQIVATVGNQNLYLFSPEEEAAKDIKLPNSVGGRLAVTSPAAVVPLADGLIILVDWKTGAIVGKPSIQESLAADWISTCALDENRFAAISRDGNLQIYELNQSPSLQIELLAEKKLDRPPATEMVGGGKMLWLAGGDRTLLGLDTDSLEEKVAVDLSGPLMFGPRLVGENLVATTNQEIICITAASGNQVWQQPLSGRRIVGAATDGSNRLILASAAGEIWSVDLMTGTPSSTLFETGQAIRSICAVGDKTVYLQTADGSLLLLKLTELIAKE